MNNLFSVGSLKIELDPEEDTTSDHGVTDGGGETSFGVEAIDKLANNSRADANRDSGEGSRADPSFEEMPAKRIEDEDRSSDTASVLGKSATSGLTEGDKGSNTERDQTRSAAASVHSGNSQPDPDSRAGYRDETMANFEAVAEELLAKLDLPETGAASGEDAEPDTPVYTDTEKSALFDGLHGPTKMPDSLVQQLWQLLHRIENLIDDRNQAIIETVEMKRQLALISQQKKDAEGRLAQKLAESQKRCTRLESYCDLLRDGFAEAVQTIASTNATLEAKQLPKFKKLKPSANSFASVSGSDNGA